MTIYEYTAIKNPRGAFNLLTHNNVKAHKHPQVLAKQLAQLVRSNGENALMQIAEIHPDLPLFKAKFKELEEKHKKEISSNKTEHAGFSSADGQAIKSEMANLQGEIRNQGSGEDKSKDMLIMGGVILLGLALILKK